VAAHAKRISHLQTGDMEHWYTAYTKPHCEQQVSVAMQRRGIETFLPEFETKQAPNKRKMEPLFPCYLFIKANLKSVGLPQVQWTPGVRRIVSFDDQPAAVPEEAINLIKHKLAEMEAAAEHPKHSFQPGDSVRITEGPMRDMLAVFEGPTTASKRVQVLLTFLGRVSRLSTDASNLEPASPGSTASTSKRPRRTRGRGRRIR
jgi:transcriptional antiterminator RfaH